MNNPEYMQNGDSIEGKLIKTSDNYLLIENIGKSGQKEKVPKEMILKIERGRFAIEEIEDM